jgi:hypothetical protein
MQQEMLEKVGDQSQMLNEVVGYFEQVQITSKYQETPPEPVSTVPFNRDPDFIDRGTLLDEINVRLSKWSSDRKYPNSGLRIALVGLGGVG